MPSAYILIHVARSDANTLGRVIDQVPDKLRTIITRPPAVCDAPEEADLLRDELGTIVGSIQLLVPLE